MKPYKQLASEQRHQIYGLKQAGLDQSQIAIYLGVNKSTISRELSRNKGQRGWRPKQAQSFRDERKRSSLNGNRISSHEWADVERLVRADFSPEQVEHRLALEGGLRISHETVYRHIYADKKNGGDLHQHLRSQKPHRKRYASGQERRGVLKNRVSIDERPAIVEQKTRVGDWEGDTVIGKNHKRRLGHLGRPENALCAGGPHSQQARRWSDRCDNAFTGAPQRPLPHHHLRQRQRIRWA